LPYKNKEKQKEYMRKWIANRRTKWFNKNGPCKECGSEENLELHHLDPKQKENHRIWSWSWERIFKETAKCEVLCSKCHDKKHLKELRHGTVYMYTRYKCKCPECKFAKAVKNKKDREKLAGIVQR
jgi:5-methylcytosine-specific restriction endonuclease McrA